MIWLAPRARRRVGDPARVRVRAALGARIHRQVPCEVARLDVDLEVGGRSDVRVVVVVPAQDRSRSAARWGNSAIATAA